VQDTSLNNSVRRKYYHSSSFKMAMLFTILLGGASATLGYFMYAYGHGTKISETEVVIAKQTYDLIMVLGIISIILMSLVVLISFLISTFVVSRINIIGLTAKRIIDTGDLSKRINIDSSWDDLSNLSTILNALISKIEAAMEDVRQVSDNIAHDLRTPLSRLTNRLQDLKLNPTLQNDADSKENIEKTIIEAERIMQTFNALLRISNIAKAKRHTKFENIELGEIINDVIDLYEPLAEEKNINIIKDIQPSEYIGDKNLIFQAVANIIDNAIKFNKEGGNITISATSNESGSKIIIADSGIGIREDERDKIFNKFYRSENSRNTPGNGLGLAMVAEIIKLHKGKIILEDNKPGLKLIITL
jgi:two-component system sensor kinase